MRKILIGIFSFALLLFSVGISIPYFFKSQVKETLLKEVDKNIDAHFNHQDLSFSIFKKFPLLSVSFKNASLIGKTHFKFDTLIAVKETSVSFNLISIIFKNQLELNSIQLKDPIISAKVLKNGLSNIDIFLKDSSKSATDKPTISIDIQHWSINNGKISYKNDLTNDLLIAEGVEASGKGDLKKDVSDLFLNMNINSLSVQQNGIKYISRKTLNTKMTIGTDLKLQKFTFNDIIKINEFGFKLSGSVTKLNKGLNLDVNFNVDKTEFRSLLSILPGFHFQDLDKIETKGEFSFNGFVKGDVGVDSLKIPMFQIDFAVDDGMFQFKHLPKAVKDINFHLHAQNSDGFLENTVAHITNLNFNIGGNPIHGLVELKGLKNLYILADIKAKVNLADLEKMYPLDGIQSKGNIEADIKINGKYNKETKIFPLVDAYIKYEKGNLKLDSLSLELKSLSGRAEVVNKTGHISDTYIRLDSLTFNVDDKPFKIAGMVKDLSDLEYDLFIKGILDLEKITSLFQLQDYSTKGIVNIDIETKGKMSDLTQKNWNKLCTNGKLLLKDFELKSKKNPFNTTISFASINFTPHDLQLTDLKGKLGQCNFNAKGEILDYLPYLLAQSKVLTGTFIINADTMNVSDYMVNDSKIQNPNDTILSVYQIPNGINLTLKSAIKCVNIDKKKVSNLETIIKIKDAILLIERLTFLMAGSTFKIDGIYDSKDIKNVKFETNIEANKLEFNQALVTFANIQVGDLDASTNGIFSTKYYLKGLLGFDYKPQLHTLTGKGKIVVDYAKIKGLKMFHHISKITKRDELHEPQLDDIIFDTEIKNSKILVKPLSFKIGKYNVELEGTHTFENNMNYIFRIGVPPINKLKIPMHITGNPEKPIVKLGKGHENFDFSQLDLK